VSVERSQSPTGVSLKEALAAQLPTALQSEIRERSRDRREMVAETALGFYSERIQRPVAERLDAHHHVAAHRDRADGAGGRERGTLRRRLSVWRDWSARVARSAPIRFSQNGTKPFFFFSLFFFLFSLFFFSLYLFPYFRYIFL
jgi:hypothetical protein